MTDGVEMTENRFSKLLGNDAKGDCYRRGGFRHDDSEDGTEVKHMEGGGLNDTNQSFQDEDVKENEFTQYVHDAKSELQNQVIKMYLLSVIFSILMYFLFYYLISQKYDKMAADE